MICGAGGTISSAVARAFAREGAKLFPAGRTLTKVEAVAQDISAAGSVEVNIAERTLLMAWSHSFTFGLGCGY